MMNNANDNNTNETKPPKQSQLKHFPVMMFAITMGFGGLTLDYKKAIEILSFSPLVYKMLSVFVVMLFCVIAVSYVCKICAYPKAVLDEFNHPIRVNFFATISMSTLLLSNIFHEYTQVALVLFILGAGFQIFIAFYAISYWLKRDIEFAHSTPAWFIPVVGNLLVVTAGAGFADHYTLMFFFSLGIFFWIILSAILVNRIIFHGMLVQKFLPTLAIFIAPPAVGMLGYLKINHGEFDYFAEIMLNVAIIFAIILFALARNFYKLKFFISWWAFTFPFAALTLALLTAYEVSSYPPYYIMGFLSILLTTCIILFVAFKTIQAILRGELFVEEK
ncbi:C4-dicarboxylate ABC transporter [Helicobacter sp. MIT 05-5293]|uniref:SLAC1 anion channel family protein n=1 Tax=Helicobacter sp. MIT 05-5293 TaxID=1548149 RepID=UPI0009E08548|nr:SLAC1 anion channel family protein [Helicobacter sp. MIT 05-5293]TLD81657.1 C4-dicarboxylate ABC transporter [Helicobacter sp. MIT 05-5293]